MKKSILLILVLTATYFGNPCLAQDSVTTSYGEITIPTYEWRGKDDINPSFRSTSQPMYSPYTTTYPYPTQDNLSKTKTDVVYKTMVLENKYLRVTVIPELGGHVHSVYDKLTGKSIVYENKVVKPALIGLRGAWISGGIEFNTGPQGHTVTCLSLVDAQFITNSDNDGNKAIMKADDDGSKAIVIGNVEQVYHTQWWVTIRLRPDKDYLEENIHIYNPDESKHLYYFWNCVAVENTDSLQLVYPMTLGQDHPGKNFYPWPMQNGKDMSWLKNYNDPSSIFAYRCDQDFYGAYDHALDCGLMAYSNHFELEGKKSWTWGKGTWGTRFQACLTDDGSHYNEIQTGPLPTQADYGILDPHQTVEWKEWWYPVRGTKGVAFSNKDVTVNVSRNEKKKSVTLLINGTGTFAATCAIEGVGEQPVNISPDKAVSLVFTSKNLKDTLHITISEGNNQLADFTNPIAIPLRTPPLNPRELPSDNTAAGCWLRGIQSTKEGGDHLALDWFKKAIEKDENFSPAMTSLAQLYINAGEYESAKKLLEKAIKLNPDDGWAMYYLARADWTLGNTADALEMAYHAAHCSETISPAYSLAGSILLSERKYDEAIIALNEALEYNANDLVSMDLLGYALLKSGNKEEAGIKFREVHSRDPLDWPLNAVIQLGDSSSIGTLDFPGHVNNIVDFFLNAGLKQEAILFLKAEYLNYQKTYHGIIDSHYEKAPNPLAYYYYGVLTKDKKYLDTAMTMNPDYVFPNSLPCEAILKEAIKMEPGDWKAKYYLGNFLFEHSMKDSAVKLWKEAVAINDSYSVLHRNLGLVAWKMDKNYWQAIAEYEKAIQCNPNDITLYRDLASIYIDNTAQYEKAKELLEDLVTQKNCTRADIVSLLTRTYNLMGDYDKSIALLAANSYSNWEGRGSLYTIYTDAHIGKGEQLFTDGKYDAAYHEFQASMDYPATLGPGMMSDPTTAPSQYRMGLALEKLGKKEEAIKEWKLAAEQADKGSEENKKFAEEAKEKLANDR